MTKKEEVVEEDKENENDILEVFEDGALDELDEEQCNSGIVTKGKVYIILVYEKVVGNALLEQEIRR